MIKDCHGNPLPVYSKGIVSFNKSVDGAVPEGSVSLLKVVMASDCPQPLAGQFFMLPPAVSFHEILLVSLLSDSAVLV